MGHEEKIHREHYRMPVVHREILRMSRLSRQSASGKNENKIDKEESNEDTNNALENNVIPSSSNYSRYILYTILLNDLIIKYLNYIRN